MRVRTPAFAANIRTIAPNVRNCVPTTTAKQDAAKVFDTRATFPRLIGPHRREPSPKGQALAKRFGEQEEPSRAVHQQELQMAPPVAPSPQMGTRLRPSTFSVVATSAMRKPASATQTTISVANSIPVVVRPSLANSGGFESLRPQ